MDIKSMVGQQSDQFKSQIDNVQDYYKDTIKPTEGTIEGEKQRKELNNFREKLKSQILDS